MSDTFMEVTKSDSPAKEIIIVREDGTQQVIKKGFVVERGEINEEEETMTVLMHGCNISGREMISLAIEVLVPIAEQAFGDEKE